MSSFPVDRSQSAPPNAHLEEPIQRPSYKLEIALIVTGIALIAIGTLAAIFTSLTVLPVLPFIITGVLLLGAAILSITVIKNKISPSIAPISSTAARMMHVGFHGRRESTQASTDLCQ